MLVRYDSIHHDPWEDKVLCEITLREEKYN